MIGVVVSQRSRFDTLIQRALATYEIQEVLSQLVASTSYSPIHHFSDTMASPSSVRPFKVAIEQSTLDDLQTRLRLTRWPDEETVPDWSQGVPLAAIQGLCEYWQTKYDWRQCEALLNSYPQFTTMIDGVEIYFLHIRSKHENALPLLLTHGWPGSILEFRNVIEKLIDPESHGGSSADAFHLVIPALPGYAFSTKPRDRGWNIDRTALAWAELMRRLDYTDRGWAAQGGDWGAFIVASLGRQAPEGLKSVHFNSIFFQPKVVMSLTMITNCMLTLCRKKYKFQSKTPRAKDEPCTSKAYEMLDIAGTLYNSQLDRRLSATGLQIRLSHRPRGSTRSSETGLTITATWRQCSRKTRCSTPSCCIGFPILERHPLGFIGNVSLTRPLKR